MGGPRKRSNMIPLQAYAEPTAWVVVALCIVMVFVVLFGFIWAYGKLREGPDLEREFEGPGRPGV